MAINALQVAWISRLAQKGIIRPGDSMVEFGPQDVISSRRAVELYALRHQKPAIVGELLEQIFDGANPRATGIAAFYRLFGAERYRSIDLLDARSNWRQDFNRPFRLPERFRVATNFGTAEHVFNIGEMFRSMHDALLPGGVALYVLPSFGDINHGFYNIHPTLYFDLAAANGYVVDNFHYVDRWDIRARALESDLAADIDFDALPIGKEQALNTPLLQRMVTETFVANFHRDDTQTHGAGYPSTLYDYCICALRKVNDAPFQLPVQHAYGGGAVPEVEANRKTLRERLRLRTRVKRLIGWS